MSADTPIVIVWFRQDLRLADNPALIFAAETKRKILPLYILDDDNSGKWKMGEASRWWLHESLKQLNQRLDGKLCYAKGDALTLMEKLVQEHCVEGVYWNRCYEPWRMKRDAAIKRMLTYEGIEAKSFNGSLLFEPHQLLKSDGTPYKVFTPFYRKAYSSGDTAPSKPQAAPQKLPLYQHRILELEDLKLLPDIAWYRDMAQEWTPGEAGASQRLQSFLSEGLTDYKEGRDYPARPNVSRLSPHLHFGELSPNQAWYAVQNNIEPANFKKDGIPFLRQLAWREFSCSLLFHNPDMPTRNLHTKFDAFPWREDPASLKQWQRGQTGYPIVDAGMRELWKTGYMHNRVRMIVGSFLVKNLLLHWHHGEQWFWDTLVDADLANNSVSWQWIAGCGADAAPYFRVFNPVTQGQRFDPHGDYVLQYVPELAQLPKPFLHCPWEAPAEALTSANIKLGETYPHPIVELKPSRERALAAYSSLPKGDA